jgi:hypothetical protein
MQWVYRLGSDEKNLTPPKDPLELGVHDPYVIPSLPKDYSMGSNDPVGDVMASILMGVRFLT